MQILREGNQGPDVTLLQTRLRDKGFPPGVIDGNFGAGTEAALIAFQRSTGLLADGVMGSSTAAALGFANADLPPLAGMPNLTVAMVSKMFPGAPLGNIKANLPSVLKALQTATLTAPPVVLAALATIRAETAGFVPINEGQSIYNTSPNGHPFDLYDNRKDLGNLGAPDGASFRGRGYVQLTGRNNYEKFGRIIGLPDLVTNPDQANDPQVAATLLAAFVAAVQMALKQDLLENDFRAARKLVNGGSHGLDQFTDAYQTGAALLAAS